MRVEIVSDVVCPWCYIGKRRFEAALERFEGRDRVEVVWKPYQLDPTAPRTPSPVLDAYARKFGGPERAFRIVEQLTEVARGEGLEFHMERGQRANTLDAHRLLWWAEGTGHQDDLAERLFDAYFTRAGDVADRDTLVRLAGEAGLDPAEAAAVLDGERYVAEVRAAVEGAADVGITAVPTFVFEGRFSMPGAQDPDTILTILRRVAERFPESVAPAPAPVCTDDVCEVPGAG